MQIRTRLTLQFLLIGGIIMITASSAIYISSSRFRSQEFYNRLSNKARSTTRLLLDSKTIDPERVRNIEKDNPVNLHNERIIILNFLNDTVYSSDEKKEIRLSNESLERIRMINKISFRQGDYEGLGILYMARLDRFVVIAAATDNEGFQYLKKLKFILIIVCFISFVVFSVAGWLYSGRALKPISDVVGRVEEISITSLNLRVAEGNGTDEIGRLAKTFNSMLQRLETSFTMQKDFISNASHELRTPLTSINGQLEVLMMKERNPEEYRAALNSVLEDIRSLIDLSNRLLLIARTSSENPVKLFGKIRLDEIIWQAQEELARYNNTYRVNIYMDDTLTDSDRMVVDGDEYLLRVAVSNIMENGCKYSPDHSVDVRFEHPGRFIEVKFEDRGIGISEEDLKKVFEPFYRGSNTISYPGSGIGLQLVSQIIKNHNGTIKLTSALNKGTTVTLTLPLLD